MPCPERYNVAFMISTTIHKFCGELFWLTLTNLQQNQDIRSLSVELSQVTKC